MLVFVFTGAVYNINEQVLLQESSPKGVKVVLDPLKISAVFVHKQYGSARHMCTAWGSDRFPESPLLCAAAQASMQTSIPFSIDVTLML